MPSFNNIKEFEHFVINGSWNPLITYSKESNHWPCGSWAAGLLVPECISVINTVLSGYYQTILSGKEQNNDSNKKWSWCRGGSFPNALTHSASRKTWMLSLKSSFTVFLVEQLFDLLSEDHLLPHAVDIVIICQNQNQSETASKAKLPRIRME